ncbi:MAG: TauD/TfdA family dioxygenase, partial [Pseudomonadota bacterium]|nr:TauD/TfdA family dioxygenase [Pseudomonadota bacterium]
MKKEPTTFNITPMSGGCGAEVSGVNLSKPMEKEEKKLLEEAWLEYQVLFFRNQPLTPQQHVDFAKGFGELQGPGYMPTLDDYPNVYVQEYPDLFKGIVSDVDWHIDASFLEKPLKGAVLYAIDVPETGGDTTWVNLYEAYDSLSDSMKTLCSNLTAVHDNFH